MEHEEALRRMAVEKYLLNEMPQPERDEFEAHFFGCQDCAADLRATAAFLEGAKQELRRPRVTGPAPAAPKRSWFEFSWRPAFAAPAFALLLLVIVYQNVAVLPRFSSDVAPLKNPEILTSLSLIGANARGGNAPSVKVTQGQPLLLSVDIPAAERFSSYTCVLVDPSGAVLWRLPVSSDQAKDTVAIRVPARGWVQGDYRLIVQGLANPAGGEPAELASYRFTLNSSN
jgi:hypothetical protein